MDVRFALFLALVALGCLAVLGIFYGVSVNFALPFKLIMQAAWLPSGLIVFFASMVTASVLPCEAKN